MINKIKEIIENTFYYCWYLPKSKYYYVKVWFRDCLFNPYYRVHLKKSIGHYRPWDYMYFIEIQYDWLCYSIYYYEKQCKYLSNDDKNFILRKMKLAKRMLEIYMGKDELFKFEDDPNADPNLPPYMRIKHVCIPYVNLKNKERFKYLTRDFKNGYKINFKATTYDSYPEELYRNKALNIYINIFKTYLESWWD